MTWPQSAYERPSICPAPSNRPTPTASRTRVLLSGYGALYGRVRMHLAKDNIAYDMSGWIYRRWSPLVKPFDLV